MSIADGANAYRLFLGRNPESDRIAAERGNIPLAVSLADFVVSEEFSWQVLAPLIENHPLPHIHLSVLPTAELISWAASELPLSNDARQRINTSQTWRQLLMHVLADEEFYEKIGVSRDRGSLVALKERSVRGVSADTEREVVGVIDDASPLEIRGWAANLFDLSEQVVLEFLLDNIFIGTTVCGRFRRDVHEALGGGGNYGFSLIVPAVHHHELQTERLLTVRDALTKIPITAPVRLRAGQIQMLDTLTEFRSEVARLNAVLARIEADLPEALGRMSFPFAMYHEYQEEARRLLVNRRTALSAAAATLAVKPVIGIVVPDRGAGARGLLRSLRSLQQQIYGHWECIVPDNSAGTATERTALLDKLIPTDPRIRAMSTAGGPSDMAAVLNRAFADVRGTHLMILEQGDILGEQALYDIARCLQDGATRLVTFDEDTIAIDEFRNYRFCNPRLKPSFDYDFQLASNYIGGKFLFARDLFEEAQGIGPRFEDAAFLDLLLRMLEKTGPGDILHIARVLYHNVHSHDLPVQQQPAHASVVACINAHLERTDSGAVAMPHDDPLGEARASCQRIRWPLPDPAPTVSIIIPTRDRADLLGQCLNSVFASEHDYPVKFEVIVVDHESIEPETHELLDRLRNQHGVRVLPFCGPFNWSAINNAAAERASGDVLLFLNNDTMVLSSDWVREMASQLARPSVGAVGARLLYEDGSVQHAGVLLGVSGGAIHEGVGQETRDGGYFGRSALQRNVLAVTGACMATRAALFRELGGFDESNLGVEFNDTDYCLRVCERGLSVIYTPFATLYHFESKSRGFDKTQMQERRNLAERNLMTVRWRKYLEQDPYYNAHFERYSRPFSHLRYPEILAPPGALVHNPRIDLMPWFE
jgi:GT2 family glycosyltransferase